MFPINVASATAEITMYSRHVTKMDIYLYRNIWENQVMYKCLGASNQTSINMIFMMFHS
jgi:hypothetical protein